MKADTIEIDYVGHLVQMSAEDWRIVKAWLSARGVTVRESSRRKKRREVPR